MTVVHNYVVDAVSVLSVILTIRVEIDFVFAYCCRPGFYCTFAFVNIELKVIQIVDQSRGYFKSRSTSPTPEFVSVQSAAEAHTQIHLTGGRKHADMQPGQC